MNTVFFWTPIAPITLLNPLEEVATRARLLAMRIRSMRALFTTSSELSNWACPLLYREEDTIRVWGNALFTYRVFTYITVIWEYLFNHCTYSLHFWLKDVSWFYTLFEVWITPKLPVSTSLAYFLHSQKYPLCLDSLFRPSSNLNISMNTRHIITKFEP